MCAFVCVLITAGLSDRLRARGPFMIGGAIVAIAGYIMLLVASKPAVRYGGTFLVASGVFTGSPMVHLAYHCCDSMLTDFAGDGMAVE
jgi:hypothetical protein